MWVFDQYRVDADELRQRADDAKSRLRIIKQED
jgi:hypothetical protein